ncbi:MAG: hypothetical protein O3A80_00240 [bacterium]|nr:hypothetical protein [bacterium]MDA1292387.1 hypothetical protein [bacterium]
MKEDRRANVHTDEIIADTLQWDAFDPGNFSVSIAYDPKEFGSLSLRSGMCTAQVKTASGMCNLQYSEIEKVQTARRLIYRLRCKIQQNLKPQGYTVQQHSFNDLWIHEEGPPETVYRSTVSIENQCIVDRVKEGIHRLCSTSTTSWKPFAASLPETVLRDYSDIAHCVFLMRSLISSRNDFLKYLQMITQDNDPFA